MNVRISLRINRMTVDEQIAFVNSVISAIAASPSLGAAVSVSALTTKRNALVSARTDRDTRRAEAKSATETVNARLVAVQDELRDVAAACEAVANGDASILESGGFNTFLPGKAFPLGKLPAPENLLAEPGDDSGSIVLSWTPVYGNKGYQLYLSADPVAGPWVKDAFASSAHYVLQGLETGTMYWFKVCALGAAGEGTLSDVAGSVAR